MAKLIIVPPSQIDVPSYAHVTVGDLSYRVNDSSVYFYTPIDSYCEMYQMDKTKHSTYVDMVNIRLKVWENIEMLTWMEENLQKIVLLYKSQPNIWSFVFWSNEDKEKFNSWWDKKELEETILVSFPEGVDRFVFKREINTWCERNLTEYKVLNFNINTQVAIRNPEEAVLFKLTWCDGKYLTQ